MRGGDERPIVVVGDALLDRDLGGRVERICPDAPVPVVDVEEQVQRPGGAGLAAALVAAVDRRRVTLVTALADDAAGRELAGLVAGAGVEVVALRDDGATAEKVRVRAGGQTLVRVDRGGPTALVGPLTARAREALGSAAAVLVSDYGRGVAAHAGVREALATLPRRVPVVWDPHPRGPAPVEGVHLVTPNLAETAALAPDHVGDDLAAVHARATSLRARWHATAVTVTMGRRGALLADGSPTPQVVAAPAVEVGDTCGAGDRFAGAAALALATGSVLSEAVAEAVAAASAFVATGGAAAWPVPPAGRDRTRAPATIGPPGTGGRDRVAEVRARGGTVVATGGCFDLLHAGHVATLRAARALGDCLVVLLNSDASVRRLKGEGRPLQAAPDRAGLLAALDCVDAVEVFDDDTPVPALRRLRPDVFAKGGDYAADALPETVALAEWGGQVVVLPYLDGRSTTRLVQEASRAS